MDWGIVPNHLSVKDFKQLAQFGAKLQTCESCGHSIIEYDGIQCHLVPNGLAPMCPLAYAKKFLLDLNVYKDSDVESKKEFNFLQKYFEQYPDQIDEDDDDDACPFDFGNFLDQMYESHNEKYIDFFENLLEKRKAEVDFCNICGTEVVIYNQKTWHPHEDLCYCMFCDGNWCKNCKG
jgi:hypothetical protein